MKKSAFGSLLEEISWGWRDIRAYRNGGHDDENVLTVEVFQILDFLPRTLFLGEVLKTATGAESVRNLFVREIEEAEITLLPGNSYLIPSRSSIHSQGLAVQPDAFINTPSVTTLVEAKRIGQSSFQPEQLAREFTLVMRTAADEKKTPLLLLVLGSEPPIKVKGHGRLTIHDAIAQYIESVITRAENHTFDTDQMLTAMPEVVSWITWEQICNVLKKQAEYSMQIDQSTSNCIKRLIQTGVQAIESRL